MEMGCIGFLIGAITAIIMIGIGVVIGNHKDTPNRDSDVSIYIPMRYRSRGWNQRDCKPTSEEIVDVLCVLRLGASEYEKSIIDYLIDKEEAE